MTHPLNRKKPARIWIDVDMESVAAMDEDVPDDPGQDGIAAAGRTERIWFRALSKKRFNDLVTEHTASDEAQDENRREQIDAGIPLALVQALPWDIKTFPPALIAACAVDPTMTLDEATEMWDESDGWSAAEQDLVFSAALIINQRPKSVRFPKELERILSSGRR